jgi:hypothetical protein
MLMNPSVIFGLLLLAPACSLAQSDFDDRFSISLGAFITDRNTDARLDSAGLGTGTDLNFEDDLGLDTSDSLARLDGYYRFNQKHRLNFSVFDLSRDSSATIQGDIQFGESIFAVDTIINAEFDLTIAKLAYTYSFYQRDNGYVGVTAGIYVADSNISLTAPNLGQTESSSLMAPLPVLGLRGEYDFADRWRFSASGEFFAIEFDNVDGSLVDLYLGIDYRLNNHVAIGLGYNAVNIDVEATKNDFSGKLDWGYGGVLLFFKFDF